MKFIHISDTHLIGGKLGLYGLDPYIGLKKAIESINRYHDDADFLVLTGDLADEGEIKAYEKIKEILSTCKIKSIKMMGNHDNRENFLSVFKDSFYDDGFIQGVKEFGKKVCIFLDTKIPNTHAGDMCDKRFNWLKKRLLEYKNRDIFLFMHHNVMDVGIDEMDDIKFKSTDRLREIFLKNKNIKYLFFGHLHMSVCGVWGGVPYFGVRGTNHQLSSLPNQKDTLLSSAISPAYGVIYANKDIYISLHEYLAEEVHCVSWETSSKPTS